MTREALLAVIDYAVDQQCDVQLTFTAKMGWTADFINKIHSEVCFSELVDKGHDVKLETDGRATFARIM